MSVHISPSPSRWEALAFWRLPASRRWLMKLRGWVVRALEKAAEGG